MQHDRAPRRPLASRAVPTAVVILAVVGLAPSVAAQATPEPDGTIAFIEDRVRIHTIRADGSDDRVVFGLTPEATSGIQGVAWRPDGQRLAFASGHEELCSIWQSDVYLMDRDGTDLTRLTNGPACADIGGLPTGTVRVTVANTLTEPAQILLHAQGLEMAQAAEVAPGTRSTFVLPVHDLGPDSPQFVVASDGGSTWFDPAVFADVRAGETTETRVVFTPAGEPYGFRIQLPEDEKGAALSPQEARALAERESAGWKAGLEEFGLVEQSQEVRPGGRVDHTLVYERSDVSIGDGRYRLRLVVAGDRRGELKRFVHVTHAFTRR